MSLCQQLNDALQNHGRPLDGRLAVAHKVFSSSSIPIVQKEDAVLRFISASLNDLVKEENVSEGTVTQFLECLGKCFESDKRRAHNWDLRPETADSILNVLPEVATKELPNSLDSVFNCARLLLSAPRFQRWLSCDVTLLCNFLGKLLQLCSDSSSVPKVESLINILEEFLQIYRMSSFKEEGQMGFIRDVVFPLGLAVSVFDVPELTSSAVHCVNSVVFYSRQVLPSFWDLMRLKTPSKKSSNPLELLVARLKSLPKHADAATVSSTFCLIVEATSIKLLATPKGKFEASLEKRQKDMFELFILLSQPLGITVNKKVSISLSPVENWKADGSYAVVRDMIRTLDKIGLPLSLEFDGFSLNSWLMSLVIGMTSINLTELSPSLLEMINSAFSFNPLVIEPSLKIVGHIMVRKKPVDSSEAYVQLMKTVFQGAAAVQRLQKTLSLLLVNVQESMSQHLDDDLTLEDIVPEELGALMSQLLEALPNAQLLSTFRAFLFHLERDCLNFIEAGCTDPKVLICTEIIGDLLSRLMFSAKIADHSVPDEIKAKFNNIFEDMKIIMGKIGSSCQETHDDRLLRAYLKMCYACGELHLMIEDYEGAPIKRLEKKDLHPVNFSYLHPYLSGASWEKIGLATLEHENCLAKTELLAMMVQKARGVARAEEGTDGPGTMVARLILESASVTWMWSELVSLAPLFQAEELVRLVTKLVRSASDDQSPWKHLVDRDEFLENRCLVLATALTLMHRASKRINKSSFTYKIMSNLQLDVLLEYELSQLITDDDDLADQVKLSTKNMAKILEGKLMTVPPTATSLPDKSFFEVLHRLPVHRFSVPIQSCLLLSMVSLLWELPSSLDIDTLILDVLYRILSGTKKNSRELLNGLDPGILLKFLAARAANYSEQNRLMKALCVIAMNDVTSCKQLIKQVHKLDRNSLCLKTMIVFSLTQAKRKTVFKPSDEDFEDEESENDSGNEDINSEDKLLNRSNCIEMLLREIIPILESEKPSCELATAFYLFLRHCLKKKALNSSENQAALKKLPDYLDIELKSSLDSRLVETLIKHLSDLGELLPSTLISEAWRMILNSPSNRQEYLVNLVFTCSNTQEFQLMLFDLHHDTAAVASQTPFNSCRFDSLCRLWGLLVTSLVSYEKSRLRSEVLGNLSEPLTKVMSDWRSNESVTTVKPIIQFFIDLIQSTSVEMKGVLIDCCLVALETTPLLSDSIDITVERITLGLDALFALIHFRGPLISDRLPAYLLPYRRYLTYVASVASPDCALHSEVALCSNKLEMLTKEMVKKKKDMTRVAQYLVADLLGLMENHPLHHEVKTSFSNMIYDFMSLFDKHSLSFVSNALPPSTQELFKIVYRDFNKYHKYTGKI